MYVFNFAAIKMTTADWRTNFRISMDDRCL